MWYVVVAALSFLGGFGLASWRRSGEMAGSRSAPAVAAGPAATEGESESEVEVDTYTAESPAAEPAPRDPRIDEAVAAEVLTVADRLSNPELSRRLRDALRQLPDLMVVDPRPGSTFDPLMHEWAETRPTSDPDAFDTVAEVLAPGFVAPDGRPLRLARVAVHDQINN